MHDRFIAAWRTAAQALFALLIAWLTNRGLHIDEHWTSIVELAVIGAGAGVWAMLVHTLQSQAGDQWYKRLARAAGRVLVLGATAVPSYAPPPPPGVTGQYAGPV